MHSVTDTLEVGTAAGGATLSSGQAAGPRTVELYQLLVHSVRDYAIVMLDTAGRVVSWNEGAQRIKGWSAEEVLGQSFTTFFPPDVAASGFPRHELESAAREGHFEDEGWRVRKDGSRFWANVVLTALRDADARLVGFGKVTRDLTARREAEVQARRLAAVEAAHAQALRANEQLERQNQDVRELAERLRLTNLKLHAALAATTAARAEAEAATKARDEFVAMVAHDLRNPVAAVKGHLQMLRRRAARGEVPPAEQLVERLEKIEATLMTLSAQVDELHEATLLQAGRALRLRLLPTDLVALAREGVLRQQIASDACRLSFESAVSSLVGTWDAVRLERVLANLLSNAVKYSPAGGDVLVEVSREAGWAVLSVADHGLGVPAADLPHIFERYRRARNVGGRIAGSGLGLAGARDIIEQHGGTITLQSEEGRGSTFVVRLPMDTQPSFDEGRQPAPSPRGGSEAH